MTNYKAILLYHSKGNTTTQIAAICQCSRTTVLKVIKRATELNLQIPISDALSNRDLYFLLYPDRDRNEEYYLPSWSELDKDMLKRNFTKYRAWQKYCRVAKKLGLKAYGKSRFYDLYNDYFFVSNSASQECSGEVLAKIKYFEDGLEMIVNTCGTDSDPYEFDYIMLFTTTKAFVETQANFIKEMCNGIKHPPVINIVQEDSCENGIVFDVEYKACMCNDNLVEIGTFQIDEGSTDFAYGICYREKPVTTVHAVFFGSSIERTIYSFCDLSIRNGVPLPQWLAPVHVRIIPETKHDIEAALSYANKLIGAYRVEVDDRSISSEDKIQDASKLMIGSIIRIGLNKDPYYITGDGCNRNLNQTLNSGSNECFSLFNQFYPVRLSEHIL